MNRKREEIERRNMAKIIKKQCLQCKNEFMVSTCEAKKLYCSKECADKARIGITIQTLFICQNCKKEFLAYPKENRKYCSKHCASSIELPKEVIDLYNSGLSIKEISLKFGYGNVRNFLVRNNIQIRPKNTDKINRTIIKDLYYKGLNDNEIADHMDCSLPAVFKIRHELGLQTNFNPRFNNLSYKQKQNLSLYGLKDINHMDCFRTGAGSPGEKHETAKFVICRIISQLGHHFLTEAQCKGGIIDVYDFTDKIIYEFETDLTDRKRDTKYTQLFNDNFMNDFFIFNLNEMPDDYQDMKNWLKQKLSL